MLVSGRNEKLEGERIMQQKVKALQFCSTTARVVLPGQIGTERFVATAGCFLNDRDDTIQSLREEIERLKEEIEYLRSGGSNVKNSNNWL